MKGESKMFIFPIVIAIVAYYMISNRRIHHPMMMRNNEALEKLKIRYVSGEIDDETYIKMKTTLS